MKIISKILLIIISFSMTSCVSQNFMEKDMFLSAPYHKNVKKVSLDKKDNKIIFTWALADTLSGTENTKVSINNYSINDTIKIEYWNITHIKPKRNLIFFIANSNNLLAVKDFLVNLADELELNINAIHYRGYGNSTGKPEFSAGFSDNQTLYNFFKKENFNNDLKTDVMGFSVGSVFASKLAAKNKDIENLILLSPLSNIEKAKKNMMENQSLFVRFLLHLNIDEKLQQTDNIEILKDYDRGLLIIQSVDDEGLTRNTGFQFIEECKTKKKELLLLSGGNHFGPVKKEYSEKVMKKIEEFTNTSLKD